MINWIKIEDEIPEEGKRLLYFLKAQEYGQVFIMVEMKATPIQIIICLVAMQDF